MEKVVAKHGKQKEKKITSIKRAKLYVKPKKKEKLIM